MTYDQEKLAELISLFVTALCFGFWQGSYFAGAFMFMLMLEWKAAK